MKPTDVIPTQGGALGYRIQRLRHKDRRPQNQPQD